MEKQFERLGLKATRVSATEPDEIDDATQERHCDTNAPFMLSPPQLGCALSHTKVWQQAFLKSAERVVVFEDDVVLSEALPEFLDSLPTTPIDIIKIESPPWPLLVDTSQPRIAANGIGLREFRSTGWGSAGYIITRSAAERLQASSKLFDLPIDSTLFCPLELPASSLKLVQSDPALCIQLKALEARNNAHQEVVLAENATQSDITFFIHSTSWRGHLNWGMRQLRWGLIKAFDSVTKTNLRRRLIPFR